MHRRLEWKANNQYIPKADSLEAHCPNPKKEPLIQLHDPNGSSTKVHICSRMHHQLIQAEGHPAGPLLSMPSTQYLIGKSSQSIYAKKEVLHVETSLNIDIEKAGYWTRSLVKKQQNISYAAWRALSVRHKIVILASQPMHKRIFLITIRSTSTSDKLDKISTTRQLRSKNDKSMLPSK